MTLAVLTIGLFGLAIIALALWRQLDHVADQRQAASLLASERRSPARFEHSLLAGLPEPARRYFQYTIAPGTPLKRVAQITMRGQFGFGDRAKHNYVPMTAEQVLALDAGFIWKMHARSGLLALSGSDTERWTRFWLAGIVPIARAGGNPDHARSAFGRYAAEALFWTPAALLPSPNVQWTAQDADSALVTIRQGDLEQTISVAVDGEGRPLQVSFQRWSNANPDKSFQWLPFGGTLSDFREFDGFRLPTHVEAGNQFGTAEYFPFFIVDVSSIHFPGWGHA